MNFERDEYLFKKKYGEIKIPRVPEVDINYLNGVKDTVLQKNFFNTYTIIKPDSVIHRYAYYTYERDLKFIKGPLSNRPLLRSDISKLQYAVENSYKTSGQKSSKSILIYSGVVDKKGKLSSLKLIEGTESLLSKKLMQTIAQEDTVWWPVMHGGKLLESPVRFSISIKKDKTLSLSIL